MGIDYISLIETSTALLKLLTQYRQDYIRASVVKKGDIEIEIDNINEKIKTINKEIVKYKEENPSEFISEVSLNSTKNSNNNRSENFKDRYKKEDQEELIIEILAYNEDVQKWSLIDYQIFFDMAYYLFDNILPHDIILSDDHILIIKKICNVFGLLEMNLHNLIAIICENNCFREYVTKAYENSSDLVISILKKDNINISKKVRNFQEILKDFSELLSIIILEERENRNVKQTFSQTEDKSKSIISETLFILSGTNEKKDRNLRETENNHSNINLKRKKTTKKEVKTILIISSSKGKQQPLIGRQLQAIKNALKDKRKEKEFIIKEITYVKPEDLVQEIESNKPDIVHFFMHNLSFEKYSENQGGLYFENGNGESVIITSSELSSIFRFVTKTKPIECVILNACNTSIHVDALFSFVPNIVYTTDYVPDEVSSANSHSIASLFAERFYKWLFDNKSYQDALNRTKLDLQLSKMPLSIYNKGVIEDIYAIKTK